MRKSNFLSIFGFIHDLIYLILGVGVIVVAVGGDVAVVVGGGGGDNGSNSSL